MLLVFRMCGLHTSCINSASDPQASETITSLSFLWPLPYPSSHRPGLSILRQSGTGSLNQSNFDYAQFASNLQGFGPIVRSAGLFGTFGPQFVPGLMRRAVEPKHESEFGPGPAKGQRGGQCPCGSHGTRSWLAIRPVSECIRLALSGIEKNGRRAERTPQVVSPDPASGFRQDLTVHS